MAGKEEPAAGDKKVLEVEASVTGAELKVEETEKAADGYTNGRKAAAAVSDETVDAAAGDGGEDQESNETVAAAAADEGEDQESDEAAAGDGEDDPSDVTEWEEAPLEHIHWVLAKKRESVPTLESFGIYTQEDMDEKDSDMLYRMTIAKIQELQDDFFDYQDWVRETYMNNGRVMVPKGSFEPSEEYQKSIDDYWYSKEDCDLFAGREIGDSDSDTGSPHSNAEEKALPSKL